MTDEAKQEKTANSSGVAVQIEEGSTTAGQGEQPPAIETTATTETEVLAEPPVKDNDDNDRVVVDIKETAPPPETAKPVKMSSAMKASATSSTVVKSSLASIGEQFEEYDQKLLHQAVADAGRWAYGIILVEVWVLNEDKTKLYRPEAGWWIDPVYHNTAGDECLRLVDPARDDYVPPANLSPGEGLPGALWAETDMSKIHRPDRKLVWRDVKNLAGDPDQPWNPRLKLLADLHLSWSAAAPFRQQGTEGIVVFMARETVDQTRLKAANNTAYLFGAADLIAAAYALRNPRAAVVHERRAELHDTIQRVRTKFRAYLHAGKKISDLIAAPSSSSPDASKPNKPSPAVLQSEEPAGASCDPGRFAARKLGMWFKKLGGGGVKPPPSFNWLQTAWTLCGSFITFMVIARLNLRLIKNKDNTSLAMGPLGALMSLYFGLTAAPASQPRNSILGMAISICIGKLVSYAEIDIWLKQAIAVSLATAVMVKSGIVHPPGGAQAIIFVGGKLGWDNLGYQLVGYIVAMAMSAGINNFNDKRQYPTFWGFGEINELLKAKEEPPVPSSPPPPAPPSKAPPKKPSKAPAAASPPVETAEPSEHV